MLCKGGSRTYYISEKHFELCRLNLSGKMPLESGRMLFLTPMSPCTLRWGDEALELNAFDSVVVPAQLEGVLLDHPAVAVAACVGVVRQHDGVEIPKAVVVLRVGESASAEDIMNFVADRVAPYKQVRAVEFIDAIPKSATGKILRKDLRKDLR